MSACRSQHLQFLLSKKKLLLVLDLDHTLLSSTRLSDLPDDMLPKAEELLSQQGSEQQQLLFKLPHMLMWTKLRPGIRQFLVEAHKLFELHIYTHGDQDYAAEMARLLDPNRSLFGGRVISGVSSCYFDAFLTWYPCALGLHKHLRHLLTQPLSKRSGQTSFVLEKIAWHQPECMVEGYDCHTVTSTLRLAMVISTFLACFLA